MGLVPNNNDNNIINNVILTLANTTNKQQNIIKRDPSSLYKELQKIHD